MLVIFCAGAILAAFGYDLLRQRWDYVDRHGTTAHPSLGDDARWRQPARHPR